MSERFLVYVVNGNGLGHLVRTLAVVSRLRDLMADAQFLFLTSCEDLSPAVEERFTCIKVPSWHSEHVPSMTRDERAELVRRATDSVFENFSPTALITDVIACGMYWELGPYLGRRMRKFIFLRPCRALKYRLEPFFRCVRRYDQIFVPYAKGADVDIPPEFAEAAHWVGPVLLRSPEALLPPAEARQRLALPAEGRIVLVTVGGGGSSQADGHLAMALQVAPLLPDTLFAVARPPLSRSPLPADLPANVRVFSYIPLIDCLRAFDGAISSCGTNGSAELVMAGIPMVWLPLDMKTQDQAANARRYGQQGIGLLAKKDSATAVARATARVLDPAVAQAMRARMLAAAGPNGADVAAGLIRSWCDQPRQPRNATSAAPLSGPAEG